MDLTVHGYKWNRDEIKIVWKEDLWYWKKKFEWVIWTKIYYAWYTISWCAS